MEKRIIKDFKFTLRDNKTPKYIRIMMNVSIAIFVVLTVLQTVSLNIELKKFSQLGSTFELVKLTFNRFSQSLKLIVEMRMAINIITNEEPNYTVMTSDGNRLSRYLALIKISTDSLKEIETQLPANSQWDIIKDSSQRKSMDILDFTYVNDTISNYSRSLNLQNFMQMYIIKASILENYRDGMGKQDLDYLIKQLVLNFQFIYYNGITSLLERFMSAAHDQEISVNKSEKKEKISLFVLYVTIGIIGILSLCILIPLLIKVNRIICKIISYFSQFAKDKISSIADRLENFKQIMAMNFAEMKKFYGTVNFNEDIKRSDDIAKDAAMTTDQIRKRKVLLNQRYSDLFSNKYTANLYKQFVVISLGFIVLMIYSISNGNQFFNRLTFIENMFSYTAYRPSYLCIILAVLRIEINAGGKISYGNITDLYSHYINLFNENEINLMNNFQLVRINFPSLFSDLSKIESNQSCDTVFSTNTYRSPSLCKTSFNYIFKNGVSNAIYGIIGFNNNIRYQLLQYFNLANYSDYKAIMRKSVMIKNITDSSCFYLFDMLDMSIDKVTNVSKSYFKEMSVISYTKFSIAVIFVLVVYLIYIEATLYKLSHFIWKIKNLLGLIPIDIMINKADDIKMLIKELS